MASKEPTFGFVKPADIIQPTQFTDFSTVPSNGYSLLVRAKRHGRWWMLKGLKEPYRQDAIFQTLLRKEYEITSQLQHPMVVPVFSLEEVEGLGLCIVMEWIEGLTLKEWLTQGKHTMKQRRHVADMLMEALAYVQSRQTQHRDLKPSNIMLTHDGQHLKLIDFGLSDTDSHAILKAPAGTEGYMAPEVSSDIYSLGCILRELRVGWWANQVIRKCRAPLHQRYSDITSVQKAIHRCWRWPRRINGVVNYLLHRKELIRGSADYGHAFEHLVVQELVAYMHYSHCEEKLSYWRTYTGVEVDIIVGDARIAIEIKSTEEVKNRHIKNLKVFGEEHPDCKLMIVSLDVFTRQIGNIECIYVMDFFHRLWTDGI